ncbi:MAG: cobyrinate a,c-diamide synthase, partial [Cutibacterium granulosum]|nr:cobyrinate a,c-diamide synthase [Cutibacterium granulosum]
AGVILNRVASPRHAAEIRRGLDLAGLPVLGEIPRNPDIFVPSRHLGLVPAAEREESARQVEQLAQFIGDHVDLTALLHIADAAPQLDAQPWDPAAALAGTGIEIPGVSPDRTSADRTLASSASRQPTPHQPGEARPTGGAGRPVVAMAGGRAFTFRYPETAELLEASGFEVVDVDPLTAPALPQDCCGLYLGGGFPEVHATELSANTSLHDDIRRRAAEGMPIIAECAGLLYLCRHLDGHDMASVLPLDGAMNQRLTMGYRTATAPTDTLVARAGDQVVGHEFHRTQVVVDAEPHRDTDSTRTSDGAPQDSSPSSPHSSGLRPDPRSVAGQSSSTAEHAPLPAAWTFPGRDGVVSDGVACGSVHASYLHLHWAGTPQVAARFAKAVWQYAQRPQGAGESIAVDHSPTDTGAARPDATSRAGGHANRCRQALPAGDVDTVSMDRPTGAAAPELVQPGETTATSRDESVPAAPTVASPAVQESAPPPPSAVELDLRHHGDQDVRQGLIDLAVNVRVQQTPVWLINAIVSTGNWAHYPDPSAARNALAAMHQVPRQMVLPTSGGAEGFTLIAHALRPEHPLVVHPQFTEPESALIQAGFQVTRLILDRSAASSWLPRPSPTMPTSSSSATRPTPPDDCIHVRSLHGYVVPGVSSSSTRPSWTPPTRRSP